MASVEERVLIAGAGPVGLTAAAFLVKQGIPVTVFEAGHELSLESRASTFHPPTLDMLSEVGAAEALIAGGLKAPYVQYRSKRDGIIAQFDFGEIADLTQHPFRLQAEQFKLTRILLDRLSKESNFAIEFDAAVEGVEQDDKSVRVQLRRGDKSESRSGRWLIGADGARSAVRNALGIEFEGFTWPERFLVLSTPFDFQSIMPDLVSVSYVADPECWHFLLRVGPIWRVMFPIPTDVSDEAATTPEFGQSMLQRIVPGASYEVQHRTLYRVHQRVAKQFGLGRTFLVGDAAHINNPLGGMGMNGGIHDAVNLARRLGAHWKSDGREGDIGRYDPQRRLVTLEYVQNQTIQNKRDLEAADEESQKSFRDRLHKAMSDREQRRGYLQRISMIASLRRAEELG
ncbi:FAD-dependent monooxygenase [Microbacteriaceae bacterium K1510]|nr:FAD-dependent monooxygenase [Microbacteriaceae bacterium K1510]